MMKRFMKKIFAGVTVALMFISSAGISNQLVNAEEMQQEQDTIEQVEVNQTEAGAEFIDQDKSEESMGDPTIVDQGTDGGVTWSLDDDGFLNVNITGDLSYVPGPIGDTGYFNYWPWYEYRDSITTVKASGTGFVYAQYMFYDLEKAESIDVSNLDTSNVTSLHNMFNRCKALSSLDLSGFETSNVTDMSWMFNHCEGLQSVNVSSFDTRKVKDMSEMFFCCESLSSINLSNFNTACVMNMADMFGYCFKLKSWTCEDLIQVTWNTCHLCFIIANH